MNPFYILGIDLAQSSDYTALCVLERTQVETGRTNVNPKYPVFVPGRKLEFVKTPVYEYHYAARHLERLPIGTPYPAQVARIKALSDRLRAETKAVPQLVADSTGVGRPVIDVLRSAELAPAAVTITGGDTVSQDRNDYRVPKRDLVSIVQVLLQSERLKIARGLPEASTLTSELLAFKVSISLKGHDSYGNDVGPWRENPHDDMVLAVALAAWYGENVKPVTMPEPMSFSFRTI